MPIYRSRHRYRKFFRPDGLRYAWASKMELHNAIACADMEFEKEHGYFPRQEHVLYEIMGITAGWSVTILEIKD